MKIKANDRGFSDNLNHGMSPHMPAPGIGPRHHHRSNVIEFETEDFEILAKTLGSEAAASSALGYCEGKPSEIQTVVYQQFRIICKLLASGAKATPVVIGDTAAGKSERMVAQFPSGVIDDAAKELYYSIYAEDAGSVLDNISDCPYEVSVISRLAIAIEDMVNCLIAEKGAE